jgi:hypothetical protein
MRDEREFRTLDRNLGLHPGINFSNMPVGGDVGGLIFVVGSVGAVIIGLPYLGWFFGGALAGGLLIAAALVRWPRRGRST